MKKKIRAAVVKVQKPHTAHNKNRPHQHTKNTVLVRRIIALLREYTEDEIAMLAEKYLALHPFKSRKGARARSRAAKNPAKRKNPRPATLISGA